MKNKLLLLLLFVAASIFSISVHGQQLAFPGAEGFGKYAKGARAAASPTVYHVTNLNDSGTGSLRDAISQPGRIVVFDVSGVINLKSRLVFSGNSYIAGQTAPGDGIILYGNGVSFSSANDLIVRHLRIYMGKSGDKGKDAAGIANGKGMIFDHMSVAWGLDENFSINWDSKGTEPGDITIQNSIIGQGIMTHSAGGLIQTNNGVSIIGCLYIDNSTRNPKVKGLNQFINNVIYNWGGSNGYIMGDTSADSWAWVEGNYFIGGPNSSGPFTRATPTFQIYQANNFVDTNKDGTANGTAAENAAFGNAGFKTSRSEFTNIPKVHPDIEGGIVTPDQALTKAIASVGASLPARSHVDAYMINELLSYGKKGQLIGHERENEIPNNIGVLSVGTKALDTDGDGIPDAWETANGLNPNDASDAVKVAANGYLNIENYINSIEGPVAPYLRCPSNITLESRTTSSVKIAWKNNSADADQIVIQKSENGTSFVDAGTANGTETSFDVTGLQEDTYYYFRLIGKKSGLADSTPSEIFRETTAGPAKAPDKGSVPSPAIGATSRYYTSVDFTWEDTTRPWGGDVSYDVYFGTSADALAKVGEGLTAKSFTYTEGNMAIGNTYYWRVDATNNIGTTKGDVWNFIAGSYSFTTSYIDLGVDFNGTNVVNPQSGVKLSSSKTYTINNDMTISISGAAMNVTESKDNLYGDGAGNQSSNKTGYIYATADAHYIQGILTTASAEKNIASVKVNGTSADVAETATAFIVFSDAAGFDTKSIVGYEEVEFAKCRAGNSGYQVSAPIEAKSFRIYKVVTLGVAGEDLYEINGTVNPETLKGTGNLRIGYIGAGLQLESHDDPSYKDPDNSMKSLTINGKKAIFNEETKTFSLEFIKGTTLGDWPVTFVLGSTLATTDFVSGSNHNFANGPLSIKVTAQDESVATYTVNATVSNKTTVAILTATGAAASYDNLLLSAFDGYNVQFLDASAAAPADINAYYQDYDLIVLHASVAGGNAIGLASRAIVGVKPVLNLKAYFYNSGRWDWAAPSNTEIGRVKSDVNAKLQNHPIFKDVTFDNSDLTLFAEPTTVINAFQYTAPLSGSNWTPQMTAANNTLATIDGDANKIHMHELNLDQSAKYLFIGLSNEGDSYTRFNTNTVNMLKNAASYLLNPNVYYDYTTNSTVGIKDNNVVSTSIQYLGASISNPDHELITIFNSVGVVVLVSDANSINVQHLSSGLYIAKSKTATIKFIK